MRGAALKSEAGTAEGAPEALEVANRGVGEAGAFVAVGVDSAGADALVYLGHQWCVLPPVAGHQGHR